FADGSKKTLGLIYAGQYHFGTDAAERMDITAGLCKVRLDGSQEWKEYGAGSFFRVPAKSGFDIAGPSGLAEYGCSFEEAGRPCRLRSSDRRRPASRHVRCAGKARKLPERRASTGRKPRAAAPRRAGWEDRSSRR